MIKPNKVITGLRHYDTHDIDYVYRKTYKKAKDTFNTSLVELDVFMVHQMSKLYAKWAEQKGMKQRRGV